MRNTRKILIAVLVVLTLLISMAIVASAASVRITGSFNGWGTAANTSYVDGLYVYKVDLTKGSSYTFKVYNGSWLGNNGSISDTTITSTYNGGWDFTSSGGDCTLKATTGGTYIFQWNDSTKKLNVFPHNSHELETETVAATCTENGSATHTCTVAGCGHVETEVLQALGHSYVDGSCSVCGEAEPSEHEHFYVETITQAPTCTVPGVKSFNCACGEDSYTEEIPVIAHSYMYGACSACDAENPDYTFYIEGYIDNKDYTGTDYAFVNGELTIPAFTATSYVYVTDSEGHKFMTSAYSTATSDTFRIGGSEKMLIPTGFDEVKFTVVNNKNGTVTLSYEGISSCDHNWVDATCQEPRHCTVCEETDGENLVNHYYVDGTCTWCTATISAWTTVYADNAAGWETVYCYAWSNTSSIGTYHAWPGKAMTLGEDGLWSAQIPSSYDNVIFCNNNGAQSPDLKVPTTSKVIYNNSTGAWSCKHSLAYPCDAHCQGCGELVNENAAHNVVHVDAKAATCTENGNVEYWYCSDCGAAWLDEAQTQITNLRNVVVPAAHSYFYPCDPVCCVCYEITNPDAKHNVVHVEAKAATCTENGNVEYWYCSDCGAAWLDEAQTQITNLRSVVVPAAHSYFYPCDPVCCVCYEITNPDAKHNVVHVEAKAGTDCQSFDGNVEYWCCSYCGAAWTDEAQTQITNLMNVKVAGAHSFVEGKCTVCDAEDPDYVAPVNDKLINFSTWEEFAKETYTDGTIVKYNDIFTFIYSKNSRVDGSEQTFEGDLTLTKRLSFGGKTPTGAVPAKNALKITVDAPHIIKIWYVAGGDGRYFALMDSNGIVISETTKETTKNALYISELVIVEAGEYYLGVPADNNYIFQIELTAHEHSYSEAVTAPTCTAAGYTTHTCSCGHSYKDTEVEATGHSYADGKCTVCGEAEGVAPHEHEFVATVTEPTCTEAGYTTHTCSCGESYNDTEVAAKGHYYVRGVCTACNLAQPGYVANNKVINFSNWEEFAAGKYADGDTVEYDDYFTFIYSEKSKLDGSNKTFDDGLSFTLRLSFAGETPTGEVPSKNALKITVDGPQNLKIWYVAGGDGRYFALMDSNGAILSETTKETTKNSLYIDEIAIPAAGVYYLGVPAGNNYIFQVQLDEAHVHSYEAVVTAPTCTTAGYTTHTCSCGDSYKDTEVEALGHTYVLDVCLVCFDLKPSLVIGENNVIVPELGYTFGMFYVSEAGTYEIVSNLGTTTCIFTTPIGSEGSDFSIAADGTLGASWWVFSEAPVELQPGLYYAGVYVTGEHKVTIGAPHEHSYDKGVCTICAEADPNYVPPHEHIFINGKCECGETDPEFVPPVDDTPKDEEPVELSFIEKIIKAITEFFAKISEFFKGLFAKK